MNKKSSIGSITGLETENPKWTTKNVRTLSQNSSSNLSKAKVLSSKPILGKENFSSNIQDSEDRIKPNQNINPLKGLKRIKEKVFGEAKVDADKELPKIQERSKLLPKPAQKKPQIRANSNKSLITNKVSKTPMHHSDKKSPLSEKSTPTNLQKKASLSKKEAKKSTIQSQFYESQPTQTQFCMDTPRVSKQQNLQCRESKTAQKKLMISMFQIRKKLNEGAFSTTFEVVHIETGMLYCLKVLEKNKIRQQGLEEQIVAEIQFRRNAKNQHIQKIFAIFDDEVYIYFVEEYVDGFGVLEKELHSKRKFTEKQSGVIFKQVFDIVRYIHSEDYIHRDIRLQNLAKCFGMIKLVDFSWIACLRFKKQRDTFCGTYKYAPPELLDKDNYDESIDIWSLGILLYELTTGQSPFHEGFIKRNSHSMNFPIFLSNQLVDLIGRLLSEKGTRMRIEEILMHEWTNKWEIDGLVCKQIWDFWVL